MPDRSHSFLSEFRRWLAGLLPAVSAILALGFKDDIVGAWPLKSWSSWPGLNAKIVWPAVIFYSCLVVGLLLYVAQERAKGRERKEVNGKLDDALGKLNAAREIAETLPPDNFRDQFAQQADGVQAILTALALREWSVGDLEATIREFVSTMAYLANIYGPSRGSGCSGYVMRFTSTPTDKETALLALETSGRKKDKWQGMLVAETVLSADMDGELDTSLQPFSLRVLSTTLVQDKLLVMPGPQSLFPAGKEFSGLPDGTQPSSKIENEMLEVFGSFRVDNVAAFRGSFLSLPLDVPTEENDRKRIGVLTICSDGYGETGLMGGSLQRWKVYAMIMRPYADCVATLLNLLIDERNRAETSPHI